MKVFLFDLDGTLLNTLDDIGLVCNTLLRAHGYPEHPLTAYRHMIGNGFTTLVQRALPQDQTFSLTDIEALAEEGRALYAHHSNERTHPYEGMPEALEALHARGFLLGVLSNKPDAVTQTIIPQYFAPHLFSVVRGGRADCPLKPNPAGAFAALKELHIAPEECYYVGDSNVDMQTALAAGMIPVGVSWGFRGAQEVLDAGAQYLLETPGDILALAGGKSEKVT